MQADTWRKRIGNPSFDLIKRKTLLTDEDVADVLTWATEIGFSAPEIEPKVDPRGTKVVWPPAVLTTEGLVEYYRGKEHAFFLLRMPQMLRAMAGPLAARFQEVLAGYEDQCERDGVTLLPPGADVKLFVGGTRPDPRFIEIADLLS